MRKLFIAVLLLIKTSLFCFSENRILKINFIPHSNYENDVSFISDVGYEKYTDIIRELESGGKFCFSWQIPKTGIEEGQYQLLVYENDKCICNYDIINENFVYDKMKNKFKQIPQILNKIRGLLFIEYLKG